MVLNETQKKWLSAVGGACFLLAQFVFWTAGVTDGGKRYRPIKVIITDDCMEYINQNPIQRLPDGRCLREIRYLNYRIQLILEEVDRVDN